MRAFKHNCRPIPSALSKFVSTAVRRKKFPYLYFSSSGSKISCGSDASLDDLPSGAMTVEVWVNLASDASNIDVFLAKGNGSGWYFSAQTVVNTWQAGIVFDSASPVASYPIIYDDKWHHLAFTFDNAGDRKIRLFLDGILVKISPAASGNYVSDAADNLYYGVHGNGSSFSFKGGIGWVRFSDNLRYSADFTPLSRGEPPAVDAHTVEQWNAQEGSGSLLGASVNSPTNDGSLVNVIWKQN
jgi:hypothetical protein